VMGVERSGTTALFRSLGADRRLTTFSEGEGPLYDARMYLRPEAASRAFLQGSPGPILTKPLNETTTRDVTAVLNEFEAYRPRLIWIYRDPVNVYHSWMVERWAAGAFVSFFLHQWNARHRRLLAALGTHGEHITLVRYEDLILDPHVWVETSERVCIDGQSLFRPDSRAGRAQIPLPLQDRIDAETLDVWDRLEEARTFRPRMLRTLTQRYGHALRRDEARRQALGRAAALDVSEPAPEHTAVLPCSPFELPGLVVWLDAGAIPATAEGPEVTVWPANRGPNAVAGPGRRGALRSIPFANGHSAVSFPSGPPDAPDDTKAGFVCGAEGDWRFLYDGSPWTIVTVYRWRRRRSSFGGHAILQVGDGAGGEFGLGVTLMNGQVCAILHGDIPSEGPPTFTPIVMAVPQYPDDGAEDLRLVTCVHHPVDGRSADRMAVSSYLGERLMTVAEQEPQCAYPGGTLSTALHIGYSAGPTAGGFSGEIADVAIFATALDDASRLAVVRYLSNKHGLGRSYTEAGERP